MATTISVSRWHGGQWDNADDNVMIANVHVEGGYHSGSYHFKELSFDEFIQMMGDTLKAAKAKGHDVREDMPNAFKVVIE